MFQLPASEASPHIPEHHPFISKQLIKRTCLLETRNKNYSELTRNSPLGPLRSHLSLKGALTEKMLNTYTYIHTFRMQTKLIHVIFHTFSPSPPHFYRSTTPNHLHSYLPHAQTISQSTTPHHLSHALNT